MTDRSSSEWNSAQRRYWSAVAPLYNALYGDEWATRENDLVGSRIGFLSALDQPLVIDLAAGTGLGKELALRANPRSRYVGVDIAKAMVDAGDELFPAVVAAMDETPIRSGIADAVLCLFTSCSFASDLQRLLAEVERILRPGGTAYLSVLSHDALSRVRRSSRNGRYQTRGDRGHGAVPVHRLRVGEATAAVARTGLVLQRTEPLNAFSGLLERPQLWRLGAALAAIAPAWSHSLELTVSKPARTS